MNLNVKMLIIAILALSIVILNFISSVIIAVGVFNIDFDATQLRTMLSLLSAFGYIELRNIILIIIPSLLFSAAILKNIKIEIRINLIKLLALTSLIVGILFLSGLAQTIAMNKFSQTPVYSTFLTSMIIFSIISSILFALIFVLSFGKIES